MMHGVLTLPPSPADCRQLFNRPERLLRVERTLFKRLPQHLHLHPPFPPPPPPDPAAVTPNSTPLSVHPPAVEASAAPAVWAPCSGSKEKQLSLSRGSQGAPVPPPGRQQVISVERGSQEWSVQEAEQKGAEAEVGRSTSVHLYPPRCPVSTVR
jgi:hypothetical protein